MRRTRTEHDQEAGLRGPEQADVRPVRTRDDLVAAFRLLYETYRRCEYCDENPTEMRVSPFALLPDAATFIARHDSGAVATVSLIPDGPFGLPMNDVFGDYIDRLRAAGRRLAEVGMLADRRSFDRRRLGDLLSLFKFVYDHARLVLGVNELCITVNPHHVAFYERYLLFTRQGEERACGTVKGHPAVFLRVDLDAVRPEQMRTQELRDRLFGVATPLERLEARYRPEPEDVAFFLRACPRDDEGVAGLVRLRLQEECDALLNPNADARTLRHAIGGAT